LTIKAPFPWFGGKSRAASLIWERFGDVPNYVEPFAGSLAVLLGRPTVPKTETVNDLDCYLANFWRSIGRAPEAVARHADWPVNEADLHARHLWLVNRDDFRERMKTDPDFFDPKIAGWWVWGQCAWIGSGWCAIRSKLPHVGNAGQGVNRKLPHVGDAGRGVNRQLPHVGDAGQGERIAEYFAELAERLRRTRVCCGDWSRVLGPSVTTRHGITGLLLDPPYGDKAKRAKDLYANDDGVTADKVREWAIVNGDDPRLRIALCGYQDEHDMPESWSCVPWKARGGYGSQKNANGNENRHRERIWFSPHCLTPEGAGERFELLEGIAV
jgi:DNA adenine methylase